MLSPPAAQTIICCSRCPNDDCNGYVIYSRGDPKATCLSCKIERNVADCRDAVEIKDLNTAWMMTILKLMKCHTSKPGSPVPKVFGLSPYHCKILSPLLTSYGIDKLGKAKPLQELKNCSTFDCSWLSDRSFYIESEHLSLSGYGQDESGSKEYLADTLTLLRSYNNQRDALIPLHVDGDGHCLVHAVSRAIVGRELFWHALRTSLKLHLQDYLPQYKAVLGDFINPSEWKDIIAECDPDYSPCDNEMLGLRNVHIFGLANVLHRPILLVDSVAGMQSSGDYSALFLPVLVPPALCRDQSGQFYKPICLAWSNSGRNHYIPLVGLSGCEPPQFPRSLLPKVWGVPQSYISDFIEFNERDCLTIGGVKTLQSSYLRKLTSGMDQLFKAKHGIDPSLVADVYYCNFRKAVAFEIKPDIIVNATEKALLERRLLRCIDCKAVTLCPLNVNWLRPHGILYNLAKRLANDGMIQDRQTFNFHEYGVTCTYDARKDLLVLDGSTTRYFDKCLWCPSNKLRYIHVDGSVLYENGDRTTTAASENSKCRCGFRHWYNGREYDNEPLNLPISFEWSSKRICDKVMWFQDESDPLLNSNVHQVAAFIVHKHLPGERGISQLHKTVVDAVLKAVAQHSKSATETSSHLTDSSEPVLKNPEQSLINCVSSIEVPPPDVIQDNKSVASESSKAGPSSSQGENFTAEAVNSKKRPNDNLDETVSKQKTFTLPTTLSHAAEAAVSAQSTNTVKTQPKDTNSNKENPQQMVRLGPGYSVINKPSLSHTSENDVLDLEKIISYGKQMQRRSRAIHPFSSHLKKNSKNSSAVNHPKDAEPIDDDSRWETRLSGHSNLSRIAQLMNPVSSSSRRGSSYSDSELSWSDHDDDL